MKEKTLKIIIAVLAVLLLAGVAAYAATNYGTQDDPLITKSYLDEVVKPQLESDMQTKLDAASKEILSSAPGEFASVDLANGQTLRLGAGSQILPVRGGVSALGAMADTTAGSAVKSGETLSDNHLYMATEDGGVKAAGTATVLVSGSYTFG
jgi:hypothetical protein